MNHYEKDMTEERKQELRQLLQVAKGSLVINYGWSGRRSSIPVDVYRKCLEERWTYYGIDFFSFAFSIHFTLDIADRSIKLALFRFVREELVPFIANRNNPSFESIQTASYLIESDSTNGYRLDKLEEGACPLFMVIERLLGIALVRGIEEAVSFFNRCSCGEGVRVFLQEVAFLEGIKIQEEIQLFEGVRLAPLPSPNTSEEVARYVPGFSVFTVMNQGESFFRRTLLVIDYPGLFTIRRLSETGDQREIQMENLPFQVKFPNLNAVRSFDKFFCQVLSLVCNSAVKIVITARFFEEENSFDQHHAPRSMFRYFEPLGNPPEPDKVDIEKAKFLYKKLIDLDTNDREKLQIAIDRWVESKTERSRLDKIIDLGIAFEALYLSDIDETTELAFRLRLRAAWYLGENEEHRRALMKEFSEIYNWRSKVVHTGKLPNKTKKTSFTSGEVRQFIEDAQDRCRESIIKILEDGEFPDWNSLILGGEDEQASS